MTEAVSLPTDRARGLFVPVLTPFEADRTVSMPRFLDQCRWLLASGADGLAVFGTTSEANSLGIDEKIDLLQSLIDAGIPAARLMPGTGTCALPDTVRLTRAAVQAGCAGVLMLPPFYYKGVSDDGLFGSYDAVIQQVGDARLRIYLYHFPQLSEVPLSPALVGRLIAAHPDTVVGLKDSSGVFENTRDLLERFPGFAVFPGSEARVLEALRLGAAGCISATANVNPAGIAAVIAGWQGPEAVALQESASAVRAVFSEVPLIPALKAVMAEWLADDGWRAPRPPLLPMERTAGAALADRLAGLGVSSRRSTEA
ncbi:dihydrodipicolinate synthase family protein [Roseospira marina]|uniref:Dihydrodipicolinate synthase family protein n=1 Tax=Roseospira marina TaxID=140057 RepID=A0A5M6IH09_9PROT|nr:dihydrodipicolinate synthase family protein [Roseospira marina]KAA5607039.1 dihydrodipicolinate synthase family protein [Roseospira marina]MBB4312774.1 4-hydroxy-tetrahydrodipicolinate synthase [Roseospira marina]MBB5086453.1 4-hydroxy-tetrahydrodipicolinate synthase [Roseospira marina]